MNDAELGRTLMAFERCIGRYIESRRELVDSFSDRHFSLNETVEIQKKYIWSDLIRNPINSLWAIPFVTIKKVVETLDKIGWTRMTPLFEKLPSSIKTSYQKEIEWLIATEVLELPYVDGRRDSKKNALWEEFRNEPIIGKLIESENLKESLLSEINVKKELDKFSSSRALVADLAGSLGSIFIGWLLFGDQNLGVGGIGDRIAQKMARDRAASEFFLGKGIGTAFYKAFPPQPTKTQVLIATLAVGLLLTIFSLITCVLSDPARKRLGLQKRKMNFLVDDIEKLLLLNVRKRLKTELQTNIPSKRVSFP